jgi:hypothetical protein
MWTKPKSLVLSLIITRLMFFVFAAGFITLPWLVKMYINYTNKSLDIYIPLLITLYSSLLPATAALISLDRLLANIRKSIIFVKKNVIILRILSWCCFVVSIIYLVFGWFYIISLLISFASAFFGLILRVLKNVFEQAVELKEENDFTI